MLAKLIALLAGLPILDFSNWDGEKREAYFVAVRVGLDRDYVSMQKCKQPLTISFVIGCNFGAPGEIRTPDHLVRSQGLYPAELRALMMI